MYRLFEEDVRYYGDTIGLSRFKEFRQRTVEDVEKIQRYFRHGAFFVKNTHLLVRLINTLAPPVHYDLNHFYDVVSARALHVANMFELTSAINEGKWFEGEFYHGCPELIIATTSVESPTQLAENWREIEAVLPVMHPVENLRYMLPDGRNHSPERGLASIVIDLTQLMVQYRQFILDSRKPGPNGEINHWGAQHFVARYVLPNMLPLQTDIAITNRLIARFYEREPQDALRKHVFHLSDYRVFLDRGLDEVLKRLTNNRRDWRETCAQIPSVFHEKPWSMPDIVDTRQVWWALFLSRVNPMRFLWDLSGPAGRRTNQRFINELLIDFRQLKNSGKLFTGWPDTVAEFVGNFMVELEEETFHGHHQ